MRQLRFLKAVAAAFALAASVAAAPASAADKPDKIVISHVTSPFNVPSIVMQKTGILERAFNPLGIKVELPEITSGAKQVQALAADSLDIAAVLGGTSAIIGAAGGADVVIIAAYSRNPEAYTIMSLANGPASIEALRGKKMAGPKGTVLNQLLVAALASKGIILADVEYLNMDIPVARAALLSGSIEAATLAGANALMVENAGGKVIVNGKGHIAPTTVVATSRSFLSKHPELVQRFLAAHREAVEFTRNNPDEALRLAAEDQKITMEDARRQIGWYDFSPVMTDADVANLEADQTFMLENKMIQKRIDIRKDLVDPMAFRK